MLCLSEYLMQSVDHRAAYVSEIAVSQIEPQLLQLASCLNPRMSVGVGAIHLVLERHILHHITRMAYVGSVDVETLHGEQSAQAAWHGLKRTGVMGRPVGSTEIVYHIARWHNGET